MVIHLNLHYIDALIFCSHIHENVTMRFLTCEPNLEQRENFKDEADRFFDAPMHWLRSHIPVHPITAQPSHVVLFDSLDKKISEYLINYKLLHSIEHAEVKKLVESPLLHDLSTALGTQLPNVASLLQHVQSRTGKSILVYQRLKQGEENAFNRQEYEDQADPPELATETQSSENLFN